MPPSLGTSRALASMAHGDHLSRGDEHDQAPAEVQYIKIGPDLGPVSLNDLRVGVTLLFQSMPSSTSPLGPSATASATPAVTGVDGFKAGERTELCRSLWVGPSRRAK